MLTTDKTATNAQYPDTNVKQNSINQYKRSTQFVHKSKVRFNQGQKTNQKDKLQPHHIIHPTWRNKQKKTKKPVVTQRSYLVLFLLEIRRRYKTSTDQYPSKALYTGCPNISLSPSKLHTCPSIHSIQILQQTAHPLGPRLYR